jgi:hypothetical protein
VKGVLKRSMRSERRDALMGDAGRPGMMWFGRRRVGRRSRVMIMESFANGYRKSSGFGWNVRRGRS